MSRIAKWKVEKTKVKVVFRLQFHATHIPQSGWDKLFISFIPADSGKPTAKTTKANVRNGTCKWSDPIYETTRLLQDIKTRQYDEKLYKLVIAMGTSRSSILGESIINLADYADASKPSTVALPLHGCDSATVTVQLLTSKTGFREFEQQRELRETGLQTASDQHESSGGRPLSSEETSTNSTDKVNRVRLKERFRELPSVEEEVGPNEEYADSAAGYDGSSNTSGSVCAEKQDTSSSNEINSLKSTSSGDLTRLSQSPQRKKGNISDLQGTNGWDHGWTSEYSLNNDMAAMYEEKAKLGANLEAAESSILELKQEVSSLQRHADEFGAETQKFAEQLVSEIASGDQLANEVSMLKSECLKLKGDMQELAKLKISPPVSCKENFEIERDHLFRGLVIIEDKVRELQSKTCFGYHERDIRLLQSDFEMLLSLLQNLKAGTEQESSTRANSKEFGEINLRNPGILFDTALCQPELGVPHPDTTSAMKEQVFEISRELEESKAERESLLKKMDQMECYYESLIHELEENQRQVLGELQSLRNEHSTCIYTISSSNAEMEKIHQELSNQILKHEEEKHDFDSLTKELERRAISAESALKRARLNYSIVVDHLQKDLELLSVQVLSMYETNDNLIRQVFVDPSQLHVQGTLEMNRKNLEMKRQSGGDMLVEDMKKSLEMQGCVYNKVEEEMSEMQFVNMYLEVLSTTLQEILVEASSDMKLKDFKIDELTQQLEISNGSRDSLAQQLHIALDELHFLIEYKATCTANCNELALQNQLLETSLQELNHENYRLKEKLTECEAEFHMSVSKYEAEKTELACLFEKESLDNANLQNENLSLQEDLKNVKSESSEMVSANESLRNKVNSLVDERDGAQISLSKAESDFTAMKQKFENDMLSMADKLNVSNSLTQKLQLEIEDVAKKLEVSFDFEEKYTQLQNELIADFNGFELNLQQLTLENRELAEEISSFETVNNDLQMSKMTTANLGEENRTLAASLQEKIIETASLASELINIKEHLQSIESELFNETSLRNELESKINELASQLNEKNCQLLQTDEQISELEQEISKVCRVLSNSEECLAQAREESRSFSTQETLLKDLQEFSIAADVRLVFTKSQYEALIEEFSIAELHKKHLNAQTALNRSLSDAQYSEELKSELDTANAENRALCNTNDLITAALQEYKTRAESSEGQVAEYLQQLSSTDRDLAELHQKNLEVESALNRSLASEAQFTKENSKLVKNLDSLTSEFDAVKVENREVLDKNSSLTADLQEYKNKVECLDTQVEDNLKQLSCMNEDLAKLQKKHLDSEIGLECCLASKAQCTEENAKLSSSLLSMRSQLEAADNEKRLLFDTNSQLLADLEEYKMKVEYLEAQVEEHFQQLSSTKSDLSKLREKHLDSETALNRCLASEAQHIENNEKLLKSLDLLRSELDELQEHKKRVVSIEASNCVSESQSANEVKRLNDLLLSSENQIENLTMLNEELEVKLTVIGAKLDEQHTEMILLEGCKDEAIQLQTQCSDLSQRLSEQILRTEEFKNLCTHLKELVHEKKEAEGPSESLRIAFIKEQYESKVQELKQQLFMSKRHAEELLLKLQDAVDENENRKKSEASHLKKNEELGMKILELEDELQSVVSEKREKMNAFDSMKAELECALVSLECCKEDKIKLETFLTESNKEKSKVTAELTSTKELLLEGSTQHDESDQADCVSDEPAFRNVSCIGSPKDLSRKSLDQDGFANREAEGSIAIGEGEHSAMRTDAENDQDVRACAGENGRHNQENHLQKDTKHLSLINDQFRAQSLKSSMDNLNKELERMKNENLLDFDDDDHYNSHFPGLETELKQLQKTNQELASIFPTFKEYSDSGKALERVLALEIELAEALQTKKKSKIKFQSSFVKQHCDEEAVFKSFRDINELIKDMLEIKEQYTLVESELKEMHDRYSQLSLQFAEVEGERQKLMMTLKNVRSPRKKPQSLNCASSGSIAVLDYSP
ncbi:hypothetical protein ACFE04_025996 [Oxalis oulophora]